MPDTQPHCRKCGQIRDAAYADRTLIHQSSSKVVFENPRYHFFVGPSALDP